MKQTSVPDLSLTHGQLLWAVSLGRDPSEEVRDRARYLRQKGIPRPNTGEGPGRGHQLTYRFDDLVLVGLGLLALADGYKPGKLSEYLVDERQRFLSIVHEAWLDLPRDILDDPDCKAPGASKILYEYEFYVRLSGRSRSEEARLDFVPMLMAPDEPPEMVELVPGELPAKVYPLKQWMPKWVAWARDAPDIRRGPP